MITLKQNNISAHCRDFIFLERGSQSLSFLMVSLRLVERLLKDVSRHNPLVLMSRT